MESSWASKKAATRTSLPERNRGKSCLTNVIACCGRTIGTIGFIYIYFHNTFDTTSHSLLYNLGCISLKGRKIQLDGFRSTWKPVASRVLQESVLRPVIFNVRIRGLQELIRAPLQSL